ncbi:MAG TPA: DinB family protein [Acidimicrobiales bacterium]|nr:DinB family protein [Acidimicrobiales bacterium]
MIVGIAGSSVAVFDLEHWGLFADGADETSALAALEHAHESFARFLSQHGASCGPFQEVEVAERQPPTDEGAFDFERAPATAAERQRTLELYRWAREDLVRLLETATDTELDWVDDSRRLPDWAWWHTARQMAWHCAITESCYYLASVGVSRPPPFAELTTPLPAPSTATLLDLLAVSQAHVERSIEHLPSDLVVVTNDEVWTTRKVLRRLAGHERAENDVTAALLHNARLALS